MTKKPRPDGCFLDDLNNCQPIGAIGGNKLWRNQAEGRYYTWDAFHGEIEVFNKKGRHLGVIDAITGAMIKSAVKGRKIDV